MAEVGGDCVCYAQSPAAADIADALVALLADPGWRKRLAEAGIERAAGFTWAAAARAHSDVFHRVAA